MAPRSTRTFKGLFATGYEPGALDGNKVNVSKLTFYNWVGQAGVWTQLPSPSGLGFARFADANRDHEMVAFS